MPSTAHRVSISPRGRDARPLRATVAVYACCCASGLAATARGESVTLVHIDGSTTIGAWIGSPDGKTIELKEAAAARSIPIDDLAAIIWTNAGETDPIGAVGFHLLDDGYLSGDLARGESGDATEAVVAKTRLGSATKIPFAKLAAVRFHPVGTAPAAAELFRAALKDRLPAHDVLVSRGDAMGKPPRSLRGTLIALDESTGSFRFGDRTRKFRVAKMYGVVLAVGVDAAPSYPATIEFTDGSRISGEVVSANGETVQLASSVGCDVEVALTDVARITLRSDRVVYVSDLTPTTERVEGRLHRPWPVRRDRSVAGGPLSIGGRTFEKGLGVHSRTELTYDLDRAYQTFAATIGIDDSVGQRGSVVFRILGDGVERFASGDVAGWDEAESIIVDVRGVSALTLLVEYGEGLDLSDHADWADARLIKPSADRADRGR